MKTFFKNIAVAIIVILLGATFACFVARDVQKNNIMPKKPFLQKTRPIPSAFRQIELSSMCVNEMKKEDIDQLLKDEKLWNDFLLELENVVIMHSGNVEFSNVFTDYETQICVMYIKNEPKRKRSPKTMLTHLSRGEFFV